MTMPRGDYDKIIQQSMKPSRLWQLKQEELDMDPEMRMQQLLKWFPPAASSEKVGRLPDPMTNRMQSWDLNPKQQALQQYFLDQLGIPPPDPETDPEVTGGYFLPDPQNIGYTR
jgi:hypothetical protein